MDPAYSIIFFSSSSGAGYGLLIWLATGRLTGFWNTSPTLGMVTGLLALILVSAGLLASMLHLGHPERAWRAFSQWRTSWLSHEGVFAILTYPAALLLIAGWIATEIPNSLLATASALTIVLAFMTVACTAMIYASIQPIPRWHNGWVLPLYLLFSLASGGMLFILALGLIGSPQPPLRATLLGLLVLTWGVKLLYWRYIDRQKVESSTATATGLSALGEIRQLEAPHTSDNYLLKEMGYQIARKHAGRLRRNALLFGLAGPVIAVAIDLSVAPSALSHTIMLLGTLSALTGVLLERWLFFAEARHLVTLYYGRGV